MTNRIEIAKKFIQEQLQKRSDIIGALVVGSVARGEETESSDIDLVLFVEGGDIVGSQDHVLDTWQDGVYIDTSLVSRATYADPEKVLQNPHGATQMNDALILHDPTGFLAQIQKVVRAVFMEPKWLGIRVRFCVEEAQKGMAGLQDAVSVGDLLRICEHAGEGLMWSLVSAPLLRVGIAPSSTRILMQLGEISGELKEYICEWEGSSKMNVDDVLILLPFFSEARSLLNASKLDHLPEYVVRKVEWMAKDGLHQEALHAMWCWIGWCFGMLRQSKDPLVISRVSNLAQRWLRGVGWEGQEVLEDKLQMAESILKEIEALVADLPSVAPSTGA